MKKTNILFLVFVSSLLLTSCNIFLSRSLRSDPGIHQESIQPFPDTLAAPEVIPDTLVPDSLEQLMDTLVPDSLIIPPDTLPDTLSILMVGDVMLGTNYPNAGYLPPGNNCRPLLEPVADILKDADISFCNLEGVFAGEKGTAKYCKNPKTCYVFRMPDEFVSCITEAGFDVVSVANNHVNDFGLGGRMNTVSVLNEAGIHFAGFLDYPYSIFTSEGLKIGFCAFSPNRGVYDIRNIAEAAEIVRTLNDSCDIVLVSMHGGAEGSAYQHVTRRTELFLGADRGNVYDFAHRMIDAGADVIIGHGPHVTRGMEVYNDRFIAYSLGNFATYARFNLSGPNGIAPIVKIHVTREGAFLNGQVIPVKQTGEGGAKPDPDKRVIYKIRDLNKTDFPDNLVGIDDDGNLIAPPKGDLPSEQQITSDKIQ